MSQWAEIRQMHVVDGVPKKQIAERLGLDIKTVRRAVAQAAAAAPARRVWRMGRAGIWGSALGAQVVPLLGITGLSDDRARVWDEFINPQHATVTQVAGGHRAVSDQTR